MQVVGETQCGRRTAAVETPVYKTWGAVSQQQAHDGPGANSEYHCERLTLERMRTRAQFQGGFSIESTFFMVRAVSEGRTDHFPFADCIHHVDVGAIVT